MRDGGAGGSRHRRQAIPYRQLAGAVAEYQSGVIFDTAAGIYYRKYSARAGDLALRGASGIFIGSARGSRRRHKSSSAEAFITQELTIVDSRHDARSQQMGGQRRMTSSARDCEHAGAMPTPLETSGS